jgi:hypothetical protein
MNKNMYIEEYLKIIFQSKKSYEVSIFYT